MSEAEAGDFVALDYMRQHFFFFFSVSSIGCSESIFFVSILSSSSKSSLMLVPCLADVSMYLHFHILCNFGFALFSILLCLSPEGPRPSFLTLPACLKQKIAVLQFQSSCLPASSSHLFPTSIIGNPSRPPFTCKYQYKIVLQKYVWQLSNKRSSLKTTPSICILA